MWTNKKKKNPKLKLLNPGFTHTHWIVCRAPLTYLCRWDHASHVGSASDIAEGTSPSLEHSQSTDDVSTATEPLPAIVASFSPLSLCNGCIKSCLAYKHLLTPNPDTIPWAVVQTPMLNTCLISRSISSFISASPMQNKTTTVTDFRQALRLFWCSYSRCVFPQSLHPARQHTHR